MLVSRGIAGSYTSTYISRYIAKSRTSSPDIVKMMQCGSVSRSEPVARPSTTPRWIGATPYQELQKDQIRLLRVESDIGHIDVPINCTLSTHDLATAPVFTALSYTWGLPHQDIANLRKNPSCSTHFINCNGNTGQVGENLHDFLDYCVHHPSETFKGYLWIDALSINQDDIKERSEQVRLMSSIYQTAVGVFVWLGPEDPWTESAFVLMDGLLRLDLDQRFKLHPAELKLGHQDILLDLRSWQALAQFFQREWFRRAWIIQEIVLAKSVILFCGIHSISWKHLCELSQLIATSSWTILLQQMSSSYQQTRTVSLGHNVPARLNAAQRTWLSDDDNKFLYALIRARSSDSENPRDKVYSQIGLGSANIFPDYRASVADVYVTAAKYILENSRGLLLLTCVEGKDFQTVEGLPSWVPDWSFTPTTGLRMTGYRDFNAALRLPKRHILSLDNNNRSVLSIEATKLDEIVDVCETKPELRKRPDTSTLWEMLSKLSADYAGAPGQSCEEAVWRTLMTNRESTGDASRSGAPTYPASSEPMGTSFRNWVLWRYVDIPEAPKRFPVSPSSSSNNKLLPSEAEIQNARERSQSDPTYLVDLARRASLYDLHYSHAMLLRPFCTRQGYFGIGTQCLEKGDSVWIVPGCPIPLILRRRMEGSEQYQLVGGAYVHGFMNGEIFQRRGLEFVMVSLV